MDKAKEKIRRLRKNAIERYLGNHIDLKRDLEIEKEDVTGYHGREILELLQNIDDAYLKDNAKNKGEDKPVVANISYKNGILKVSNTGTFFGFEGIEALVFGHISPKEKGHIGSKGSGFRSLLNWSENIRIFSGDYKVEFSNSYSNSKFNEFKNNVNIKKQIKEYKEKNKEEIRFPILSMPRYIDEKLETNYDTVIEIKIEDELNIGEFNLESQLEEFDYKTLLFLPNLSKIEIVTDDFNKVFTKEKIEEDGIKLIELHKFENDKKIVETYYTIKKDLGNHGKNQYLMIAVPEQPLNSYNIYSYFPTHEYSPFPVLIHAPFILSSDRNRISTDNEGINKDLLIKTLNLLVELAEKINNIINDPFISLEITTPYNISDESWNFVGSFGELELEDYYLELLSDAKIIPLGNGEFANIRNNIRAIFEEYPKAFKGQAFENLIMYFKKDKYKILLKILATINSKDLEYDTEELCNILNKKELNMNEEIDIFVWWNKYMKNTSIYPNLIKDSKGRYIALEKNNKIFLPTESGLYNMPEELSFIDLTIMDKDYVNALIKHIKILDNDNWNQIKEKYREGTDNKRILDNYSDKFFNVNLIEQSSREQILREINDQVDNYSKGCIFLSYLFELYKKGKFIINESIGSINYNFPTKDKKIRKSNKIFLGESWGNWLGNKLFSNTDYRELEKPESLLFNKTKGEHTEFFIGLGIRKFPEIKEVGKDHLKSWSTFTSYLDKKYSFNNNINYMTTYNIENFEEIINKLKMLEIKKWVEEDIDLREFLKSDRRGSNVRQNPNWSGELFYSNEYLKYILNNFAWIEYSGRKYSPREIVAYDRLSTKIEKYLGLKESEIKKLIGEELYDVLEIRKNIGEFEDVQIKEIMDELPSIDNGEISLRLYRDIIKSKKDLIASYNIEKLKVFCKDGKFHPAPNVKYADKNIPKFYEENFCFINIPIKQNINTIRNWLGVERFYLKLKLLDYKANNNIREVFNQEVDDIKIGILCSVDDNLNNVTKLKRLSIIACTDIHVLDEEDSMEFYLEDYNYIHSDGVFYIKIPNEIRKTSQIRNEENFANSIIDIFKQVLSLDLDDNFIELLVIKNKEGKQAKILNDYGLNKWQEAYNKIFKDSLINKKMTSMFEKVGMSYEQKEQLRKVNFNKNLNNSQWDLLIGIMRKLNLNIKDLNSIDELIHFDIRNYWLNKIDKFILLNKKDYKLKLYKELEIKKEEQRDFIKKINEFENFEIDLKYISNSVDFNIKHLMLQKFPLLKKAMIEVNLDKIYKRNFEKISKEIFGDNKDIIFADFIDRNLNIKSLLYFGSEKNFEEIKFKYESHLNQIKKESVSKDQKGKPLKGKLQTDKFKAKNLFHKNKRVRKPKNNHRANTSTQITNREKTKKYNGELAEIIAYNTLKEILPNLKWTSENAELGLPERNTSSIYDMKYEDKGKINYIEIKAATHEFFMSHSEYKFAMENKSNYNIYFVDVEERHVYGPHGIDWFESSKCATEYKFLIEKSKVLANSY